MKYYNYLDDAQFAKDYFENNKKTKSIKVIKQTLIQKGVSRNVIDSILDEDLDQKDLINKLINKKLKGRDFDSLDYKEKAKIKAYIYSKGFKFPDDFD
jgi:regulatory protein